MKRRKLLALLGGAAAAWPLGASAQQSQRRQTIGFLSGGTPATVVPWVAAFEQRLLELGWEASRNIAIEYRWAEGRRERFGEIAAEFVKQKVEVIFTHGTLGASAAKQATSTIPVVFVLVGDPIGTGLVASLSRPGGNLTGLTNQIVDVAGKRLELLREVVPDLRRLAILVHANNPTSMLELNEVRRAGKTLGLDIAAFEIRRAGDIGPAFNSMKAGLHALYICSDPLVLSNLAQINGSAQRARLPTMHASRDFLPGGGLMCYGPNFAELFRQGAGFVDKVLRGAKPADLPVEQPTKFDLVVSQPAARALGLKIPESFLLRVDEVIE